MSDFSFRIMLFAMYLALFSFIGGMAYYEHTRVRDNCHELGGEYTYFTQTWNRCSPID